MARRKIDELTREEKRERRAKQRRWSAERRDRERAKGLCSKCGKPVDRWGTRCRTCAPLVPTREPMSPNKVTPVKLTVEQLHLILAASKSLTTTSYRELHYRVALALRDRGHWNEMIEAALVEGPSEAGATK